MKKIMTRILISALTLAGITILSISETPPAQAAAPALHQVVGSINVATSGTNVVYLSMNGRGVIGTNPAYNKVTNPYVRPADLYAYKGDTLVLRSDSNLVKSSTATKMVTQIYLAANSCGLTNGVVASATQNRGSMQTISGSVYTGYCPNGAYIDLQQRMQNIAGKSEWTIYEGRKFRIYVYEQPVFTMAANTFVNKNLTAGNYLTAALSGNHVRVHPFGGIVVQRTEPNPAIGANCGGVALGVTGWACSGTVTRVGSHVFTVRSYVDGKDAGAYVSSNGSGVVATSPQYFVLGDYTYRMTLNVYPAPAQMEKSNIEYQVNYGTLYNAPVITQSDGAITAVAIWRDPYYNVPTAFGTMSFLNNSGSAQVAVTNNVVKFLTPGDSTLTFRLSYNGISKDVVSPTYTVKAPAVEQVVPDPSAPASPVVPPDYSPTYDNDTSPVPSKTSTATSNLPALSDTSTIWRNTYLEVSDIKSLDPNRKKDILWMYASENTVGCSWKAVSGQIRSQYCPATKLNRGAMAELLYNFAGSPTITKMPVAIKDIGHLSERRQKAILWLSSQGITQISNQKYHPADYVNRGSMAQFIRRFLQSPYFENRNNPFIDIQSLSKDRQFDINWLYSVGISTGIDATHFGPNQTVTRGQMANFFARMELYLNKQHKTAKILY